MKKNIVYLLKTKLNDPDIIWKLSKYSLWKENRKKKWIKFEVLTTRTHGVFKESSLKFTFCTSKWSGRDRQYRSSRSKDMSFCQKKKTNGFPFFIYILHVAIFKSYYFDTAKRKSHTHSKMVDKKLVVVFHRKLKLNS